MRYASIDLLRAVAMVLMVVVHFLENLSGVPWTPGDLGAPLFAFLAGVSFHLWAQSQEARGTADDAIRTVAVRRGLFLFALGIAFNVLVWLPEDTFNWDVLTLIGTGLIALAFARGLPSGLLVFTCIVVLTLSPFLRVQADYDSHWPDGSFEYAHTLPEVVVGYLATGYFPLFPWLAFPLAGFVAGRVLFPDPADAGPTAPSVRPLLAWGVGGILFAVAFAAVGPNLPAPIPAALVRGWSMFPASVEYAASSLGGALVLFAVLHVWVDRRGGLARCPRLLAFAGTMSRFSLTFYLLHHAVHLWPLWVSGTLAGGEPTQFWRAALPAEASIPLSLVCFFGCYFLFRVMSRRDWPSVESLMRWLCD